MNSRASSTITSDLQRHLRVTQICYSLERDGLQTVPCTPFVHNLQCQKAVLFTRQPHWNLQNVEMWENASCLDMARIEFIWSKNHLIFAFKPIKMSEILERHSNSAVIYVFEERITMKLSLPRHFLIWLTEVIHETKLLACKMPEMFWLLCICSSPDSVSCHHGSSHTHTLPRDTGISCQHFWITMQFWCSGFGWSPFTSTEGPGGLSFFFLFLFLNFCLSVTQQGLYLGCIFCFILFKNGFFLNFIYFLQTEGRGKDVESFQGKTARQRSCEQDALEDWEAWNQEPRFILLLKQSFFQRCTVAAEMQL